MPQHILVPLDGSALAEQALPHAALVAQLYGARLTLARVPETMIVPVASAGIWITREVEPDEARTHAEAYLAEVAARPVLAGLEVATVWPRFPVISGLVEAISSVGADLVVLTTHGHSGIARMLLGSVAAKLVQHAPTPAVVIPCHDPAPAAPALRGIVVPLDGSANGELALPVAADLARRTGAWLRLMRVPTVPAYLTVIPDTAAMIPGHLQQRTLEAEAYLTVQSGPLVDGGLTVAADVVIDMEGGVEGTIVDYARQHDADLTILCTHGQTGLGRLIMGSITDRVLRLADRPVWIVRPAAANP